MKPPLFTSIPPRVRGANLDSSDPTAAQRITIESWLNAGFEPVSINLKEEFRNHPELPETLRHLRVEPLPVTPRMQVRTAAPLCPLRDFLYAIYTHNNNAPVAMINADIRLAPSIDLALAARIATLDDTEFLIGQRNDITHLPDGSSTSNIHGFGIDFVAFHSSWIPKITRALAPNLAIGLPWWDHYLPLALSAYGAQTRLLDPQWFEHDVHRMKWNWNHYCRVGRTAMSSFYREMIHLKSSVTAKCWLNALQNESYHPMIPPALAPHVQKLTFHDKAPNFIAKSSLGRLASANMRILLQSSTHGPVPQPGELRSANDESNPKRPHTKKSPPRPVALLGKCARIIGDYRHSLSNSLTPTNRRPKSVYFFTFHKCASTLFSSIVLKRAVGLRNINYAQQLYRGAVLSNKPFTFQENGFIYGPIRVTPKFENNPVEDRLLGPVIQQDFLKSKRAVFLVRDPRAILTSEYYSFGFSHHLSRDKEVRKKQEVTRQEIQKITVDEYVLNHAAKMIDAFERLDFAQKHCQDRIVLRYEDLVEDFDAFIDQLCAFIPLRQATIELVYRESRPKQVEEINSHKRSGLPSGFRKKLLPETIESLNKQFEPILKRFAYEN